MRPLQFLGSLYLNDTHKIHTLGPPHIAQHHAYKRPMADKPDSERGQQKLLLCGLKDQVRWKRTVALSEETSKRPVPTRHLHADPTLQFPRHFVTCIFATACCAFQRVGVDPWSGVVSYAVLWSVVCGMRCTSRCLTWEERWEVQVRRGKRLAESCLQSWSEETLGTMPHHPYNVSSNPFMSSGSLLAEIPVSSP